ncbi:MAG: SDR family oxidoreductase [Pseudomonadota bacterium]
MKIVVIGGSGLIGANVAGRLRQNGHEVVAASPSTGVNTVTGEGLAAALAGAQVVVDVANSPSFEDRAVLEFFETSGRNLLAAEADAGVEHHVALSIVGTDRLPESGYFRAKVAQEKLIKAARIPYTILRATQFFEFVEGIVNAGADGGTIRLSPALIQPIAADDVSAVLADLAVAAPVNGTLEVGGPDRFPLDDLARKFLAARGDRRQVIADVHARYFGSELTDQSLVAQDDAHIGPTRFQNWLSRSSAQG